jgi:UDP:flavonoid glycosyltransferase YjiC (YdhE family)
LRVLVGVAAFNAGETTRGVEVARAIRDVGLERGHRAEVTFVYPRTTPTFEAQILDAGFRTEPVDFSLTQEEVAAIMHADHVGEEFVSDLATAGRFIDLSIKEIEKHQPDLLVLGFFPPAGIAAQLLGVPTVSYLPFPAYAPWARRHLVRDLPDELDLAGLAHAPRAVRRWLAGLASGLVMRRRFFTQPTFAAAAKARGWAPASPDLFGMLAADLQLVNDFPGYYQGEDVGPDAHMTGPLFSQPTQAEVAPEIREQFEPGGEPRVFVSLGSSGEKPYLLAAVAAVAQLRCRAVVVVPPQVCSLDEARARLGGAKHVLLTDAFVPAAQVNAMADHAIIHGGQGTVQTAVCSGTPVVGVGMQLEQSANLDKVVCRGAGIRIARRHWSSATIVRALRRQMASPSYRAAAQRLRDEFNAIDGRRVTGELIWDMVRPEVRNLR